MALMDPDGVTPEPQEVQEDYSDFTNPTNLLRAPSWITASPDARPQLVDRAMNAFLGDLETKKDKTVPIKNAAGEDDVAPVWSAAGTLTGEGEKFVAKTRQFLATAAQDPEGGIYQDDYSGKWETSPWVDDFQKSEDKKGFDPFHDLDAWKSERDAISTDTEKAGGTWEEFAAYANANVKTDEAKLDVDSKELKLEWARRMKIATFDPRSMGDKVFENVGGQYAINPATAMQMDRVDAEIEAMDIGQSEKRLLRLQHKDFVEKHAATFVNSFAAADAGPIDAIYSRPLNDEFNAAMDQPGASAYEFIKANKDRFNKENYGVGQEVTETFRDAVMATGTGALWLGSGGNYTSPAEAWGALAADSGEAYNNGKAFSIGGIDINRRDLTELTGQVGSFVAMGGMGSLAGRGLASAGAKGAMVTRFVEKGGKLVPRAAAKVTNETALAATKTFGEKAAGIGKALATDPEMILGSLQASGMSYGRTFNDTFERTGSREEAHKAATITGVADGLGALIATGVMNRVAPGAGKLLGMSDDGARMGSVQQIRSRFTGAAAMKETQKMFGKLANMTPELRKATGAALASQMNGAAKKLGLRGLGVVGDVGAEAVEESMDEIISGAIQSMSHDSKSWTEAEWEQISNNWQGYVKAGILGALGGTAGSVQGAAFSPKQVFGKSDALEVQDGMWKAIKANVARFDNPEMVALDQGAGLLSKSGVKTVAEYLSSDASVDEKAQVLVATARGNNLSTFTSAVVAAPVAAPISPTTPSATTTPPASPKGSVASLMAELGAPVNEGEQWSGAKTEEGDSIPIKGIGKVSLVSAPLSEEGGLHPVAVKVVAQDGTVKHLSAEQAVVELGAHPKAKAIVQSLENSKLADLQERFVSKVEPAVKAEPALAAAKTPTNNTNDNQQPAPSAQPQVPVPAVPSAELGANPASEGNTPKPAAAPASGPKAEASLSKTESEVANLLRNRVKKAGHTVSVGNAPKVTMQSIPGSTSMRSSHLAEMQGTEDSGLWIDTKTGAVTAEPRLVRELSKKHSGDVAAMSDELAQRATTLKNSVSGLKALGAKEASTKGAAKSAVDPDKALVVASDTIELGQTDELGGSWKKVDRSKTTPQSQSQAAQNVEEDGLGEDITYVYSAPKGHTLSVSVGDIVLIQGEPDSILILDSSGDGKWVFRKVSLAAEGLQLVTDETRLKNRNWNRTRLTKQAKEVGPLLEAISQGTVEDTDLRKLVNSVMDAVAPSFKQNLVEKKLEDDSFLQTNPDTGEIAVDYVELANQLRAQYQAANLSNSVANEVISTDVARLLGKWLDEEVVHVIAGKEFDPEEMVSFYEDVAYNPEHPYHSKLQEVVSKRFPGKVVDSESVKTNSVESVDGQYLVGMELIRMLHQLKHSGSYSERAVNESLWLQASVNMDLKEDGNAAKLINTVRALVKRYSDRVRNILLANLQRMMLPRHQQALLSRLDAAYKRSGANGDTEFGREDAASRSASMQREFKLAHTEWGQSISSEHFEAVQKLRGLKDSFRQLDFESLFGTNPETQEIYIWPHIREFVKAHVPEFKDVMVIDPKTNITTYETAGVWNQIDALLDSINDIDPAHPEKGPERTGMERARDLVFLNRQVLDARMGVMDFDLTPVLDLSSPDAGNTLRKIGEFIEKNVPADQRAEHYRQLAAMREKQVKSIQRQIEFVHEAGKAEALLEVSQMNAKTPAGRRSILAKAKELGLENPFSKEGLNPNDVTSILERLKTRVGERITHLAQHSARYIPSDQGQAYSDLSRLEEALSDARSQFVEAERKSLIVDSETTPVTEESAKRFTQFLEFNKALKEYNSSVRNLHRAAFGDFWERPKNFGLFIQDLNKREGSGPDIQFGEKFTRIEETSNPDEAFGVIFQKFGQFLGFRPKMMKVDEKNGVTKKMADYHNRERAVIVVASESNAAFVGRMQWMQFFTDYMLGRVSTQNEDPDTYWQTGGFSLPQKIDGDTKAVTFNHKGVFESWNTKLLNLLLIQAANTKNAKEVLKHLDAMEKWANDMVSRVSESKGDNESQFMERIGGKQTLAGRIKPLIDSQFLPKAGKNTRWFDVHGNQIEGAANDNIHTQETEGLIPLIAELRAALSGSGESIKTNAYGDASNSLRARLDGANDAVRLTNKALKEFGDLEWRRNVETEASMAQRMASFKADNPELDALRESPADIRVFSSMNFFMKFHERARDYRMGSNFAFEMADEYRKLNRGDGALPEVYQNISYRRVYPKGGLKGNIPPSAVAFRDANEDGSFPLEFDVDGKAFYYEQVVTPNSGNSLTDPNSPNDDRRTNRPEDLESFRDQRAGDSTLSGADMAINQADSPAVQMRFWKTKWATAIGSQSAGDALNVDAGRQFFFDLWNIEQGNKSEIETKNIIKRGLRGTFPQMKGADGEAEFFAAMYDALGADTWFPQLRFVANDVKGVTIRPEWNPPSVETMLVALQDLKMSFEREVIEQAKAGQDIGQALAAVRAALVGSEEVVSLNPLETKRAEIEVDEAYEVDEMLPELELPTSLPKTPRASSGHEWAYRGLGWKGKSSKPILSISEGARAWSMEGADGARSESVHYMEQIPIGSAKKVSKKVTKHRKVKKSALQANSFASQEELEAIERLVKGMMTATDQLAVYDASMLVHGIDGVGNPLLSLLIQGLEGRTLVVSPSDAQVTRFGADGVGFKIVRGEQGLPNVVYAPASQKNPETNQTETWGGVAQALVIASKNQQVREEVAELARQLRLSIDPAIFGADLDEKGDPEVNDHLERLAELGRLLGVDGDRGAGVSVFNKIFAGERWDKNDKLITEPLLDDSLQSDVMIIAEVLTNPQAKRLFDEAYLGTDGFNSNALSEAVNQLLKDGVTNILKADSGAETFDQDYVDNATEESVDVEQDYDWENTAKDSPWMEALINAGSIEEQRSILEAEEAKENAKKKRFGPDAQFINKRRAKREGAGNGLNPSDAFLFNSLARILVLGKAGQAPVEQVQSRFPSNRAILNNPDITQTRGRMTREEKAKAGPMLQGGLKDAAAFYVGEIRNLTIPKVGGRTAHNIVFNHRNIINTNAAVMLTSPMVREMVGRAAAAQVESGLDRNKDAQGFGRVDVSVPLTDDLWSSLSALLPAGELEEAYQEAEAGIAGLEADQLRLALVQVQLQEDLARMDATLAESLQIEGAEDVLAMAKGWSQSLREQTRDMVVAHVSRFSEPAAMKASFTAPMLAHQLHTTLKQTLTTNTNLRVHTQGMFKTLNEVNRLMSERKAQLLSFDDGTFDAEANKATEANLKRATDSFNLHVRSFNLHVGTLAARSLKLHGMNPAKVDFKKFWVRELKGELTSKNIAGVQGSLSGLLNEQRFADGFVDNMVRSIAQGVASMPGGMKSFAPKVGLNSFMAGIAKEWRDTGADLPTLVEERMQAVLDEEAEWYDDEKQQPANYAAALKDIAMSTSEAQDLLASNAMTTAQRDAKLEAERRLKSVEEQLMRTEEQLKLIDSTPASTPVGLGYYTGNLGSSGVETAWGKVTTPASAPRRVTVGANISLSAPLVDAQDGTAGTMPPRDYWKRSTAITRAFTNHSKERIQDAYKFVRDSQDQFIDFDPLATINQAVEMVQTEEMVMKEIFLQGRDQAQSAEWRGMTNDAIALYTQPGEHEAFVPDPEKGRLQQITLPKNFDIRKERIGTLVHAEGKSLVLVQADARELLMRHWPQTITKRNVNRELKGIVLDALPVNRATTNTESYFLNGMEKEAGEAFDGTGFSPAKLGLKKGEAAKAFREEWETGMVEWLEKAMNMGKTGKKKPVIGELSKAQMKQWGFMIERLVIAHNDPRLSAESKREVERALKLIDQKNFAQIGLTGPNSATMTMKLMQKLNIEPAFSKAFADIESVEIQKRIITGFVTFDGNKHGIELGMLKYLHHQDARIRSKARRSYVARQTMTHLNNFIQYGIDGKSGRIGYTIAKKAIEDQIAEAAKGAGVDAKDHTIGYLLAVMNGIEGAFGLSKAAAAIAFKDALYDGLQQFANFDNAQNVYFKGKTFMGSSKLGSIGALTELDRYWNAHSIDLVRDRDLVKEVRAMFRESGLDKAVMVTDEDVDAAFTKFRESLEKRVTEGKLEGVQSYSQVLTDKFGDLSSAMQMTMAMLSREAAAEPVEISEEGKKVQVGRPVTGEAWQDEERMPYKPTYSSVPLRIGYAANPNPEKRQVSSDKFVTDPIELVSLKDSSFFGGIGRHESFYNEKAAYRPIQLNGLTAPISLIDDAIYKLNVTPSYEVLRRALGRTVTNANGVATVEDGDFLKKVLSTRPSDDGGRDQDYWNRLKEWEEATKQFKEAMTGVTSEQETTLQNDAANGVLNTGGAEVMRFLGSAYIVRSLASVQQLWDQTSSASVGYSFGKLAAGKGAHAATYFHLLGKMITNPQFMKSARAFIARVAPDIYYRSADGADVVKDAMHSQRRFGGSMVKNKAGKGVRKYEQLGERVLDLSIGTGERFISSAMFLVELIDQLQIDAKDVESLFDLNADDVPQLAKSNATRKVNDTMGQADQSRKSWMFQNRTSSPTRNALWRSIVRFSNQTASLASNTSVMVPVLFDSKADRETKLEARENVVTSLAQNILFAPFKIKTLIPLVAYLLYGLSGEDDDDAQKKAQELANTIMVRDEDSNVAAGMMKAFVFGRKRELFQQDKTPDAAQASAFAEILARSQTELLSAVPIAGVLAGYSSVSGLAFQPFTESLAVAQATAVHNAFSKERDDLKRSSSPYDNNATTVRAYDKDWLETAANTMAPTQVVHDYASAAYLAGRYNATKHAERNRWTSILDAAIYGALEVIPGTREARGEKAKQMQDVVNKEAKRNR